MKVHAIKEDREFLSAQFTVENIGDVSLGNIDFGTGKKKLKGRIIAVDYAGGTFRMDDGTERRFKGSVLDGATIWQAHHKPTTPSHVIDRIREGYEESSVIRQAARDVARENADVLAELAKR